jgi:DNA-directed RNA polymerase subunit B
MKEFFAEEGLVRQHISSYDDFVSKGLQEIVDEVKEIPLEIEGNPIKIRLGRIEIGSPRIIEVDGSERLIYPSEARIRNLTYSAPLFLEMTPVVGERELSTELVYIGDLPVMLKSKICPLSKLTPDELIRIGEDPLDPGGYFIINGSERVIVGLEDLVPNRALVDIEKPGAHPIYKAKIFSTTVGSKARIEATMKSDGVIYISMPGVPSEIPFSILMKALGVESDAKIASLVSPDPEIQDELEQTFEKSIGINTARDALLYIGNRVALGQTEGYRIKKAEAVLDKNFLPHLGRNPEDRINKAIFLADMVLKLVELKLGRRDVDDKDHYANKRLRLAGSLLSELFRVTFRNLVRDMKYQLERMALKRYLEFSPSSAVRPGIITERIQHAISTGNWVRGRVGVTQLLDRTNFLSMISHLRRLQSPLSRSQPNLEARDLHPTHWGRLCPSETPEGSNCGLVKNLALYAVISIGTDPMKVIEKLYGMGVVPPLEASDELRLNGSKVVVDGIIAGYVDDGLRLASEIRAMRRRGLISHEINVAYFPPKNYGPGEVYINCDAGRIRRPLIVVEGGAPKLTQELLEKVASKEIHWSDLVNNGVIEYLDADEEENALVALDEKSIGERTTHMELAPYLILGVSASIIP